MQDSPLPLYPGLHVQVNEPGVLTHVASESQAVGHSLISER